MTRKVLLAAGATGALLFVLVALVESVTRPGYDPVVRFVSELSLSDLGWMQITNFIVCGALLLLGAIGLARSSTDSRWVPALLGVYSLALIAAGLFSADAHVGYPIGQLNDAPRTLHGTLHGVAGLVCFNSLAAAALVASYRYRRTRFGAYCLSVGLIGGPTSKAGKPPLSGFATFIGRCQLTCQTRSTPLHQMGYDLRRLKRKGLIQPVGRKLCYSLTPRGRRGALYFLTKVQAHILPPGLQALDLRITSEAPAPTYGLHHPLIKPFNNLPTSTSARLPLYFTSKMSTTTSPGPEFFAECSLASCHIACPAFISTSKLREPDVNVTLQSLMG